MAKKIINGLRYDSEKAIKVGTHHHGSYPNSGDFSHWSATLYKTPRAHRFFLHGEGGAMTRFADHSPYGGSCGGEKIIPMSKEDALAWCEQHLDGDRWEKYFEDQIEEA